MNWLEQGGGAFPLATSEQNDAQFGMSLRDWFAGHATEEDIAQHRAKRNSRGAPLEPPSTREAARYRYADAMIAARAALQGETK